MSSKMGWNAASLRRVQSPAVGQRALYLTGTSVPKEPGQPDSEGEGAAVGLPSIPAQYTLLAYERKEAPPIAWKGGTMHNRRGALHVIWDHEMTQTGDDWE